MLKLVRFQKKDWKRRDVKRWYTAAEKCLRRKERTGIRLAYWQTYRYTAFPIRGSGRWRRSKTIFGDCKKRKNCYSKERTNLKHISGAVCLLFSYSKFTRSIKNAYIEHSSKLCHNEKERSSIFFMQNSNDQEV